MSELNTYDQVIDYFQDNGSLGYKIYDRNGEILGIINENSSIIVPIDLKYIESPKEEEFLRKACKELCPEYYI